MFQKKGEKKKEKGKFVMKCDKLQSSQYRNIDSKVYLPFLATRIWTMRLPTNIQIDIIINFRIEVSFPIFCSKSKK